MTTKLGGVPIAGFMTTTDDVDVYPTHLDELGKGGIHPAIDIINRDLITPERRSEGMLCYVLDEMSLYQLSGGIENTDWLLIFTIIDGEVVINQSLPTNYIFHGDADDEVVKSPILLDVRLDLLRVKAAEFILARPNEKLNSAQVLSELQKGYMFNNGGTIEIRSSIPSQDLTLTTGNVFLGDANNQASQVQRLEFDNMPTFSTADPTRLLGVYNLMTGSANPLTLAEPTPTLSIQQCNLANLTVGKIWLGAAITPIEDQLNFGFNRPKEVDKLPTDFIELPFNKVMVGNVFDRATALDRIELQNMAKLTYRAIWRGNLQGEPEETNDFTNLELKVETLEDVTIPGIEADIAAIEGEIATLQGELAALQGEVAALAGEVLAIQGELLIIDGAIAVLQGQVLVLESQVQDINSRLLDLENNVIPDIQDQIDVINLTLISLQNQINTINTTIANLRLNNIPADGDVSFYGYKLINLADPADDNDGVNLKTLKEYRPYINIYNDNNLIITSLSANVFAKAQGVTNLSYSRLFTMNANNTIEYTGALTLVMAINLTITMNRTSSGNNSTLSIATYKNGVLINGSINSVKAESNDSKILTSNALIELNTGDILEYYIASSRNGSVLVSKVSFTITAA